MSLGRKLRIGALLLDAAITRTRSTSWTAPLRVSLYQARIYVLYYDPRRRQRVAHSLGLKEGLIGVVHASPAAT